MPPSSGGVFLLWGWRRPAAGAYYGLPENHTGGAPFLLENRAGQVLAWGSAQETAGRVGAARLQGGVEAPGQRGSLFLREGGARPPGPVVDWQRTTQRAPLSFGGAGGQALAWASAQETAKCVGAARSQKSPPGAGPGGGKFTSFWVPGGLWTFYRAPGRTAGPPPGTGG